MWGTGCIPKWDESVWSRLCVNAMPGVNAKNTRYVVRFSSRDPRDWYEWARACEHRIKSAEIITFRETNGRIDEDAVNTL